MRRWLRRCRPATHEQPIRRNTFLLHGHPRPSPSPRTEQAPTVPQAPKIAPCRWYVFRQVGHLHTFANPGMYSGEVSEATSTAETKHHQPRMANKKNKSW